jgi:hypothetical protein
MIYTDYIKNLTRKIENALVGAINRYNDDIVSVILGWNDSRTKILMWFDNEWEDFGYYDDNEAIATIDEPAFAQLINQIPQGNTLKIDKELINFPEFGNVLGFNNKEYESNYNTIRNAQLQALVDVSQNICKNQSIGKFNNLVSFKVMHLSDGEHPEIAAIYADHGNKDLMFVEVDNGDNSIECYCRITEQSLVFFLTDLGLLDEWEGIFNSKKQSQTIDYEGIINFLPIKIKNGNSLNLNTKEHGIFDIKEVRGNQKHCLYNTSVIIHNIVQTLRKKSKAIEKKQLEMPSPDKEPEFLNWCNYLKKTKNDFGWRDLEIAVAKYGVSFIYKFIPLFYKESKYYDVTLLTAIRELLKAGEFEFAYDCFNMLSSEKKAENGMLLLDILLGQEKYSEALPIIEKREDNELGKWEEINLKYRKALILNAKGKHQSALNLINTINREDRDIDYKWFKALIIANENEMEALSQIEPLLSMTQPVLPSKKHFDKFAHINAIFNKKKHLVAAVKNNDKVVVQKQRTVKINRESHHYYPLLSKNLKSKNPLKWEVLQEIQLTNGYPLGFFNFNGCNYCFTQKGFLYELSVENNKLELKNEMLVEPNPVTIFAHKNLVYVATESNSVIVYNIATKQVCSKINRLTDKRIDYLFANKNYLVISSTAGVEVYTSTNENYQLISLLSVGTSVLPYTWAKQAQIIGDYLYIASGNAGLVTYKMKGNEEPQFIGLLSCDFDNPFCSEIIHYNNRLIINMEGNHWVVDITNPEQAKSETVLFGQRKGNMFGPFFYNNMISFIEEGKPIIWNYSLDTKNKKNISCEYMIKANIEIYPYYIKQVALINKLLLLATKSEYYLLQQQATKPLDISPLKALNENIDKICDYIETELNNHFGKNKKQKASYIVLESLYGEISLKAYASGLLTELTSYNLKKLFEIDEILNKNGIQITVPDTFPYEELFMKEQNEEIHKFGKELLKRLSATIPAWFNHKTHFIYNGYNPQIDRNIYSIEQIINKV